jgi:type II secretory pathway component PulF
MIFRYKAIDATGANKEGVIDALNVDIAISSLQRRGFAITTIVPEEKRGISLSSNISFFERVTNKDIVILSRQMSTLFSAQISALRVFRLLSSETENHKLSTILNGVADDLQGGSSISKALSKYPKVFSEFYVNMVRSGEESGKLDEILNYLADYLDRSFEVTSKAKNALVYPAFIVTVFVAVMVLMVTVVIPHISDILTSSGQQLPIYTVIVLDISSFFTNYGIFLLIAIIIGGFFAYRYGKTPAGKMLYSKIQVNAPGFGPLYKKLYLSRISDNLNVMLLSAIPIIRALEITSLVVGSEVYKNLIDQSLLAVRSGSSLSEAFAKYREFPGIMIQMVKVGEETGRLGDILSNLSKFYSREVSNAVDTLVGLIEPVMIVVLGLGVAFLLASVLLPIYSISMGS